MLSASFVVPFMIDTVSSLLLTTSGFIIVVDKDHKVGTDRSTIPATSDSLLPVMSLFYKQI